MKILFVCSANRLRSRTAMEFFRMKFSRNKELQFDSCGSNPAYVEATKQLFPEAKHLSKELIDWADIVLCFEAEHKSAVISFLDPEWQARSMNEVIVREKNIDKNIRVLGIPDRFDYMDPHLIDMFNKYDDNLWR